MVRREDETLTHGPTSGSDETLTQGPSGSDETLTRGAGAGSEVPAPELDSEPGWESGSLVDERWEVFGSARGGMGRVYFVRDRQWGGTTLAVKSLLLRGNATPDKLDSVRALFRRETQVWLDLGAHQNIVSGFYTLEVGGVLRFFMEYVSGQSLAEVVAGGGLELSRALDLAIQLCAGMQYVHARNVVHRDLKPANCLIMEDDTLRVTDFGLGKSTGDVDAITSAGARAMQGPDVSMHHAGTPYYMAPEQWQSLGSAGKPADVYAFGVMLYELFAGLRPFGADPNILRRYSGNVPPMLQQLIDGGAPIEHLVLQLFHQQASPFALSTVRPICRARSRSSLGPAWTRTPARGRRLDRCATSWCDGTPISRDIPTGGSFRMRCDRARRAKTIARSRTTRWASTTRPARSWTAGWPTIRRRCTRGSTARRSDFDIARSSRPTSPIASLSRSCAATPGRRITRSRQIACLGDSHVTEVLAQGLFCPSVANGGQSPGSLGPHSFVRIPSKRCQRALSDGVIVNCQQVPNPEALV